ncbi:hypothetical protein GQR58_017111 [Nymphon striatum]|nr:hypothetical protein GQR58_017111 [Nymphon striatum]
MLKTTIACFALSHIPTEGPKNLGLNVLSVVDGRIPIQCTNVDKGCVSVCGRIRLAERNCLLRDSVPIQSQVHHTESSSKLPKVPVLYISRIDTVWNHKGTQY